MPTWVRPYLDALPTRFEGGPVFANKFGDHHRDSDIFNAAWQDVFKSHLIARKHRMPYRIPYVCRHARAAELLSNGVDPAKAAAELGHSTEMFLRTYSEFIDEYCKDRDTSKLEGVRAKCGQEVVTKS